MIREPTKTSRRAFLKGAGALALAASGCIHVSRRSNGILVNDVQSKLNATCVDEVVVVRSQTQLVSAIKEAAERGRAVSVCGGRHAMGGQQFLKDGVLLDSTKLCRVLKFDSDRGTIEVEAGIQWPALLNYLLASQHNPARAWTFAQKQTGANRFCLGGALASNIHSRGLKMRPLISDIESFTIVDPSGALRRCSRSENRDLFRLAIGGYGLFGAVYSLTLRLVPRQKLKRIVELLEVDDLMPAFSRRISDGFLYGDFQFAIDPASGDFEEYVRYYLSTSGNVYWSDLHQFSGYADDFHEHVDRRMRAPHRASEIITEIYVPRPLLSEFMADVREDFRKEKVTLIYGTIRLIERDDESFLAWAREPYACVIFNLHTVHTSQGIQHSAEAFRRLIDFAIQRNGSYYLTYHRFASRGQLEACYPQFSEFLSLKRKFDPGDLFQSDWYRHYRDATS